MALLMQIRRRMATILGVAALILSAFFTVAAMGRQAIEQQAAPSTVTFHLGWDVLGAVILVIFAAGVHLEQLRRARVDIRAGVKAVNDVVATVEQHKKEVDARLAVLPEQYVRRDWWADKLKSIEGSQERIERRMDAMMIASKGQ